MPTVTRQRRITDRSLGGTDGFLRILNSMGVAPRTVRLNVSCATDASPYRSLSSPERVTPRLNKAHPLYFARRYRQSAGTTRFGTGSRISVSNDKIRRLRPLARDRDAPSIQHYHRNLPGHCQKRRATLRGCIQHGQFDSLLVSLSKPAEYRGCRRQICIIRPSGCKDRSRQGILYMPPPHVISVGIEVGPRLVM